MKASTGVPARQDLLWAALVAAAGASLYASFPTKFYVFEGLARAMPIAAGRFSEVFQGNYLAYGLLGWCFHALLRLLGAQPSAVVSLQTMDCLIGGAGIGLFFLTLRRLDASQPAAALWSALLGVSCGYWMWSTDAQNYIFSAFVLGLGFHFLVRELTGSRMRPAALGALQALAFLGHVVNGIFVLVHLWHLRRTRGDRFGPAAVEFAATAAGLTALAYAFVLLTVVRPSSAHAALLWFLGSLKTGGGGVRWHGGLSLRSIGLWLRMSVNIFASFQTGFRREPGAATARVLLATARVLAGALALKAAFSLRRLRGARREAAWLCLAWLGAYALVFTSWEPHTMVYRVSDLVPLTVLLFLGAEAGGAASAWRAAAAALLASLALGNFLGEIYPRSFAENNPLLGRMDFIRSATPADAWVASPESQGGGEELYLPFFARRRPILLSVYRSQPQALSQRLTAVAAARQPVFVTSLVLADPFWAAYFKRYAPARAAEAEDGLALYRLAASGQPKR